MCLPPFFLLRPAPKHRPRLDAVARRRYSEGPAPDEGLAMRSRGLLTVVSLLALARPAAAQFTWTGNGADNNWSTAANWSGGVPVSGSGTSITFAGSNRLSPVQDIVDPF